MSDGISDAFKHMIDYGICKNCGKSINGLSSSKNLCNCTNIEQRRAVLDKIVEESQEMGLYDEESNIIEMTEEEIRAQGVPKRRLTEGTKFDAGKPMLDLVPPSLEEAVGEILTMGAEKYDRNNWKKGINYSRIVSSLKRHLNEFYKGNLIDNESGKPHLWHAACNLAFLIEFETKPEKYKKFDDIHGNDK